MLLRVTPFVTTTSPPGEKTKFCNAEKLLIVPLESAEVLQQQLDLGSLESQRDWGYAPDYVDGFLSVVYSPDQPQDLVFATGQLHRVRDWLEIAFGHLKLDWQDFVRQDSSFSYARLIRWPSLGTLAGPRKKTGVGTPQTDFQTMVVEMVENDLAIIDRK